MMPPKYITKYFKASDAHFYRKGQIRFGTLEFYRTSENAFEMAGRLDQNDGVLTQITNVVGKSGEGSHNVGGMFSWEGQAEVRIINATSTRSYNEHLFCASIGAYNRSQHNALMKNDSSGYSGNPELTNYVVIDLHQFIAAVYSALKITTNYKPLFRDHMKGGPVKYEAFISKQFINLESHRGGNIAMPQPPDIEKAIFSKRPKFQVENEYRIVLGLNYPGYASSGAEPFDVVLKNKKAIFVQYSKY